MDCENIANWSFAALVQTCVEPAVEEGVVAGGAHGEHVGDEEGHVEILPTIWRKEVGWVIHVAWTDSWCM